MNTKDRLYFTFKNILNEKKIDYFYIIQAYLSFNRYNFDVIQHFKNTELTHSWWNKVHYYIYYNEQFCTMIHQLISLDYENKSNNITIDNENDNNITLDNDITLDNNITLDNDNDNDLIICSEL